MKFWIEKKRFSSFFFRIDFAHKRRDHSIVSYNNNSFDVCPIMLLRWCICVFGQLFSWTVVDQKNFCWQEKKCSANRRNWCNSIRIMSVKSHSHCGIRRHCNRPAFTVVYHSPNVTMIEVITQLMSKTTMKCYRYQVLGTKLIAGIFHLQSNKPMMEKKRRARINHCLNELKTLILDAMKKDVRQSLPFSHKKNI